MEILGTYLTATPTQTYQIRHPQLNHECGVCQKFVGIEVVDADGRIGLLHDGEINYPGWQVRLRCKHLFSWRPAGLPAFLRKRGLELVEEET